MIKDNFHQVTPSFKCTTWCVGTKDLSTEGYFGAAEEIKIEMLHRMLQKLNLRVVSFFCNFLFICILVNL